MPISPVTGKIIKSKININKTKLAWIAGFFDGEGTSYCGLQRGGMRNPRLGVTIAQKEKGPLIKVKNIIGKGRIYRDPIRSIYTYQICNFEEAQYFMCLIWEELEDVKREQYRRAIQSYIRNYRGPGKSGPKICVA